MEHETLRHVLRAAAAPSAASLCALALLVAYTATGAAGDAPPRITVGYARIVPAPEGADSTAAYFEIRNTGASRDTLLYADSTELGVSVLRRTVRRTGTGRTEPAWAVDVPPGGTVRMAPGGLGVVILDPPVLTSGQTVPYTLWFRRSGRVVVRATVTDAVRQP
ncbi:copper chaperone PCu(A)C [Streptomyces griseiscabiei]|uniref:Copper chaperone PCu(A)C n=1 Tax=Streptomyces griseiscabiei TaxID=2993540 RepID=A0ABU4L4H2_9ACTN|nr:copper chaperone PCu(A)C [Streptomyces griseiscabiei]MBZ3905527.1 copper chaperone PCu(A)C [Streptomyces griseiscabiei]MDX2910617.1 copper chaperone PCu(A)C [Streptomyces griseiscabiei]